MCLLIVFEDWLWWIDLKWFCEHLRIAHHSRGSQARLRLGSHGWVKWNRRITSVDWSLFICLKYHDLVVEIGAHSTRIECVHIVFVLLNTALGTHTVAATWARVWVQIASDVATLSMIKCLQLVIVPRPCQSIFTCLFGGNEHYLRNDRGQSFVVLISSKQ